MSSSARAFESAAALALAVVRAANSSAFFFSSEAVLALALPVA
jgi:hypothetical protein